MEPGKNCADIYAEKSGRSGYGIELDPRYVDVTVKRMQQLFGLQAMSKDEYIRRLEIHKAMKAKKPTVPSK